MTPSLPAAKPPAPRRSAGARPGEPYALVGPPRNEGHGKRLTAAFEALELFPALAESRNRVLALSPRSARRRVTSSRRSSPTSRS